MISVFMNMIHHSYIRYKTVRGIFIFPLQLVIVTCMSDIYILFLETIVLIRPFLC